MGSPFLHLSVKPQLACEFLGVFARFEFALKATRFACGDTSQVNPDWDTFAGEIDTKFNLVKDEEFKEAANCLLCFPPKKQVLSGKTIKWLDSPPDPHLPRAQRVILMVRRVRNNLFHGGKFPTPDGNMERDTALVSHSLVVLRTCLRLNHEVEAAYGN